MSSLISFISVLQFSAYRSFVSLDRFIPWNFVLFVSVANGIVSLISFSDYLLLVYRNARDFSLNFVSYNFTVNSLISSSNFLVAPLGISMRRIISSANSESFASSFPTWIHLISFSSLIAVAKTCEAILNNSGESEHLCLVPDLRGNSFSFSPLRKMFAWRLSYMAFIMLR